jgi:spore coat protein U-like protein
LLLAVPLLLVPGLASAQTATTQFNVQITIAGECQINSAENLNFGNAGVLGANVDATGDIEVLCTTSTPFDLGLDEGTGTGASVGTRLMTGPGAATIQYALYRNAARTVLWGETVGVDTLAGTGTGAAQTFTVYGRVPPQPAPAPGTYTDTVTVTLTY